MRYKPPPQRKPKQIYSYPVKKIEIRYLEFFHPLLSIVIINYYKLRIILFLIFIKSYEFVLAFVGVCIGGGLIYLVKIAQHPRKPTNN